MHPKQFKKCEEIFSKFKITGRVLEVGAVPNTNNLLNSSFLDSVKEKIGLNINGPKKFNDFEILEGNANDMIMFSDEYFECVLCFSVLEHDKFFWKSISEMKRVLEKKGLMIIATPTYRNHSLSNILHRIPGTNCFVEIIKKSIITYRVHNFPGDYYRFSEQTFREIFFDGFTNVIIETILNPPHAIGYGLKK